MRFARAMFPIWKFGSEAQKQRWLPRMAKGELIGCGKVSQFLDQESTPVEIAFKNSPVSALDGVAPLTSVREMSEGFRVTVPSELHVEKALGALLAKNAKILWVSPIRPSLEDAFI